MDSQQQRELRQMLLSGGMPFWRVRRALLELGDHYSDVRDEALAAGLSPAEARAEAGARMGDMAQIGTAFLSSPDLCSWPLSMRIADAAVVAGDGIAARSPILARWALAAMASATGTMAFLFGLHQVLFS